MKRKIRVFAYPSHCDGKHMPGVDYVRVVRPMEELQKHKDFKVTIFDGTQTMNWEEVAKNNDILFLNYITNAWGFVSMAMFAEKYGCKIVYDIDDLIWEIQEDNAAYSTYAPESEGRATITDIIARGCDVVTCTNRFLRNAIYQYTGKPHEKIAVLPNFIDLGLYKWKSEAQNRREIKIGYFGSSSHFNDLVNTGFVGGMERLMSEYPQVTFYTIGAMIQQLKKKFGSRYTTGFGDHDIYKWVKMMPLMLGDVDIVVAPLVDITYCRAKSSIKFLEYSSAKLPGVYQNIRQYREVVNHGENGYLAETAHDWYTSLKELADSVETRRRIGDNAFKTVEDEWTIQKNVGIYVDLFKSLV